MSTVEDLLNGLRRNSGLSWRELAQRAGTHHSTLIGYAKGRQTPGLATLERIADAAGCDLVVELRPRLTTPERRTLEMHRAIARKMESNPEHVREIARLNLIKLRQVDAAGNSEPYIAAWEELIEGDIERLLHVLVSTDQVARDLRQSSPFAGVLSDKERIDVLVKTDGLEIAEKTGRSIEDLRQDLSKAVALGFNMAQVE